MSVSCASGLRLEREGLMMNSSVWDAHGLSGFDHRFGKGVVAADVNVGATHARCHRVKVIRSHRMQLPRPFEVIDLPAVSGGNMIHFRLERCRVGFGNFVDYSHVCRWRQVVEYGTNRRDANTSREGCDSFGASLSRGEDSIWSFSPNTCARAKLIDAR